MSAVYGTKKPERVIDPAGSSGVADLQRMRISQDFAANLGVKKLLVQVAVTKPRKGWFVRTRPGDEWRAPIAMIEMKEEGEAYVVSPDLAADLPDDVVHKVVVTTINRHGTLFLWPLRVPNNSKQDPWGESAMAACAHAETHWLRVLANMRAGAYDVFEATAKLPEPEWPEHTFEQIFRLAFRDRVIDSLDHPVIRPLKGQHDSCCGSRISRGFLCRFRVLRRTGRTRTSRVPRRARAGHVGYTPAVGG